MTLTPALKLPDVREFDITSSPMKGWILVEPGGLERDDQLRGWIDQAKQVWSHGLRKDDC